MPNINRMRRLRRTAWATGALGFVLSGCFASHGVWLNEAPASTPVAAATPPPAKQVRAKRSVPKKVAKAVVVTSNRIHMGERIVFANWSAELLPESFPVLDAVAATLDANPQIQRVAVQGHTAKTGMVEKMQTLSKKRAESVRAYLMSKGVVSERLVAEGFGESRPLAGVTPELQRRVELHILDQVGTAGRSETP